MYSDCLTPVAHDPFTEAVGYRDDNDDDDEVVYVYFCSESVNTGKQTFPLIQCPQISMLILQ